MKLLLDTHIFLWLTAMPEKLPSVSLAACQNPDNQLFLSVVSPWEIQIKQQLGKLELDAPLSDMITSQTSQNGLQILPIQLGHTYALSALPFHHKDPFDRMLIAQAKVENMVLVTEDKAIKAYEVKILGR